MLKTLSKAKTKIFIFFFLILVISTNLPAGANYPFPIDRNYPNGIRIASYNSSTLQTMFNTWRGRYVVTASPGQRVIRPEPINGVTNRTVSEGQAYGMLLAVYFADQTLFNNLWAFKVARSSGKISQLMPCLIENNGTTIVDPNSASDADFDIAFALLMAHCQWGSGGTYNYQSLAATEIERCRQYDINAGTFSVRPGDAWNDWGYPSYYSPAFFRVFGHFERGENQTTWNNVIARCLNNINTNRNPSSGLVGEICNVDTGARIDYDPCMVGCDGRLYKYNSCRVPWRYAMDWLWYGNATNSSGTQVNMMAGFFNGIAPANVRDGYRIADNSVEGTVNNACFVGPAGCSLMYSSTYSSRLSEYYTRTLSFDINEAYYCGTLQLLTLLLMTGNFLNLCYLIDCCPSNTSTCTITPTQTPTRTETPVFSKTITPICSDSPTETKTYSETPTKTITYTNTETPTHSISPTTTYSATETPQPPTSTPSCTFSYTYTPVSTDTLTETPVLSTNTPIITNTSTITLTHTQTYTKTRTITQTPSYTFTNIPTHTSTAIWTQTATSSQQLTNTFTLTPTITLTQSVIGQLAPGIVFIYPNPYNLSKGTLNFLNIFPDSIIQIYTIAGEFVTSIKSESITTKWDGRNNKGKKVTPGIYYYLITNKNITQIYKGKIFIIN